MSAGSWTALAAATYMGVVIGVGVWATRRTRDARTFYVAGRGLGLTVTALATTASALSGVVFVGGPGLTYRFGLASLFIILSVGFTPFLLTWVAGRPLRSIAGRSDAVTLPEVFEARFGHRGPPAALAIAIVVGALGYLGAQVLAAGRLIDAAFGLTTRLGDPGLAVGMAIGLVVVLAYAVGGGMLAGVYTDVVQGAIMMATGVALFAIGWSVSGGFGEALASVEASERFGTWFADPLGALPSSTVFGWFALFAVGVLGQPHTLHKFLMIDDPRKLRWLPWIVGPTQVMCLLVWAGVGLAVPAAVVHGTIAPLASADDATAAFLGTHAPPVLAGVALAGVLAAIMSTSDAFLNLAAAALTRDLPRALGRAPARGLAAGRVATVLLGVAAAALAWRSGDLVALIGTYAYGVFAASIAPAVALGLRPGGPGPRTVTAAIALGLSVTVALELGAGALAGADARPLRALASTPAGLSGMTVGFAIMLAGAAFAPADGRAPVLRFDGSSRTLEGVDR